MQVRRLNTFLVVVFVCSLASGCGESRPAQASAPPSASASASSEPAPSSPTEAFVASGPLVVENQVDVAAQREGMVMKTMVEPGTAVRKGQILGRLDDRQLAADLEAAEARIHSVGFDEKNWEAKLKMDEVDAQRAEKMWQANLITKEQLDHQHFKLVATRNELERERQDLVSAQATARSLQLELEKTRIRAPFSGVVARRYVREGQKVALGDRLFWVTAVAPLRVRFTLPERFLGRIRTGQQVSVTSAEAQEAHAARVVQISPVVDPSSGTIEVLAELLGKPGELRPGMTANIRLHDMR